MRLALLCWMVSSAAVAADVKRLEGLDESAQLVADDLFTPLLAQFGGPPPARPVEAAQASPLRKLGLWFTVGGGALLAGSGLFAYLGANTNSQIRAGTATPQDAIS